MVSEPGKIKARVNSSFVNRNLVAIVMIPAIIGIHYGWSLLQNNETLVSKDEKIDLPLVSVAKSLWSKVTDSEPNTSKK